MIQGESLAPQTESHIHRQRHIYRKLMHAHCCLSISAVALIIASPLGIKDSQTGLVSCPRFLPHAQRPRASLRLDRSGVSCSNAFWKGIAFDASDDNKIIPCRRKKASMEAKIVKKITRARIHSLKLDLNHFFGRQVSSFEMSRWPVGPGSGSEYVMPTMR